MTGVRNANDRLYDLVLNNKYDINTMLNDEFNNYIKEERVRIGIVENTKSIYDPIMNTMFQNRINSNNCGGN